MVKYNACTTRRMAGKAHVIAVRKPVYTIVLVVGFRVGMAIYTGIFCIIGRIGMTIHTLRPFHFVFSTINREILRIMVEGGRHPGRLCMARCTIGWEIGRGMVWIVRLVIIRSVASDTGAGRVVVIPVVASGTIVGNRSVRALQRVIVIVDRETCRCPTGRCGMAHGAIGRNIQGCVFRVGCLVKIGSVAARAGIGGIVVIAVVTGITIIRNGCMRTRQRIHRIVVKHGWHPGRFGVTSCAIGRELPCYVVGIGGSIKIGSMATIARVGRIGIITLMASRTIIGDCRVGPVQWMKGIVVGKIGGFPSRRRGMATGTIG